MYIYVGKEMVPLFLCNSIRKINLLKANFKGDKIDILKIIFFLSR